MVGSSHLHKETKILLLWINTKVSTSARNFPRKIAPNTKVLMRNTFGQTERVTVWLGGTSQNISTVFDLISRVFKATEVSVTKAIAALTAQDLHEADLPEPFQSTLKALDLLF